MVFPFTGCKMPEMDELRSPEVTYNGNGNTAGSAPSDGNIYVEDQTVTVLGNTGGLERAGYTFAG